MTATKYKLNNLIIIIDYNRYQSYGKLNDISNLNSIKKICKFWILYPGG